MSVVERKKTAGTGTFEWLGSGTDPGTPLIGVPRNVGDLQPVVENFGRKCLCGLLSGVMDDAILSPDCKILFGNVCAARCFVQYEAHCDPQIVWISLVVHRFLNVAYGCFFSLPCLVSSV